MGTELQACVAAELGWDPRVGGEDVAVSADGRAVTLRGTVGSPRQERAAWQAARRVNGVTSVTSHLQVRVPRAGRRPDADVRADLLLSFRLNGDIPGTLGASVRNGLVTLAGTAAWQFQREEAELACAKVHGVLGITDEITLTSARGGADVQRLISAAFARSAVLDGQTVSVDTPADGMVVLSGAVSTWAEHDEAVAAAWAAPGVSRLDDRIAVAGW